MQELAVVISVHRENSPRSSRTMRRLRGCVLVSYHYKSNETKTRRGARRTSPAGCHRMNSRGKSWVRLPNVRLLVRIAFWHQSEIFGISPSHGSSGYESTFGTACLSIREYTAKCQVRRTNGHEFNRRDNSTIRRLSDKDREIYVRRGFPPEGRVPIAWEWEGLGSIPSVSLGFQCNPLVKARQVQLGSVPPFISDRYLYSSTLLVEMGTHFRMQLAPQKR
ncbi:hypothetical protein FB45DRAFT_861024 [Roridomyces roridus]|uniref:Uncharacterized protein n=1 Tax=Roridomyces roridus TaxID=1738132 RepID=A0AAD7G163_9AGAR|nr:hypothetical protein FB45DRAFT_861024 [Roridomyces roridus]